MIENFKGKQNTNGFDQRPEDATKGGRKPSIRKELLSLLDQNGFLTINKDQAIIEDELIKIKLPQKEAVAFRLIDIAMNAKGTESIAAIKLMMQYIEGMPKQSHELSTAENQRPVIIDLGKGIEPEKK